MPSAAKPRRDTPSPPSDGGEGRGKEAAAPLLGPRPTLSPWGEEEEPVLHGPAHPPTYSEMRASAASGPNLACHSGVSHVWSVHAKSVRSGGFVLLVRVFVC